MSWLSNATGINFDISDPARESAAKNLIKPIVSSSGQSLPGPKVETDAER